MKEQNEQDSERKLKMPEVSAERKKTKELIDFETGNLSKPEIEAIFNTLPVDVTFVDANDTVRFFSKAKERIFPRTKAIIGRKVQQCHPPKSIHIVNRVIDDLRTGRRSSADFWLDMQGKKIYIRYFPVRNEKGEYLGVLEISQDITEIQKIKNERRLFDDKSSV
jgi:PAS domain S-box-containing protein